MTTTRPSHSTILALAAVADAMAAFNDGRVSASVTLARIAHVIAVADDVERLPRVA